jgi:replicative DNA helicase
MPLYNLKDNLGEIEKSFVDFEPGLPTGIKTLDNMTTGLHPGELIILSGRPGMGKSSLMTDFVRHTSATNPVLVFSMEMGRKLFAQRLLANMACVPFTRVQRCALQDAELKRVNSALIEIGKRDIYVEGSSLLTPMSVERVIVEAKVKQKIPLSAVYIDHLHYMEMDRGVSDPLHEVTQITKYLKAIAREYEIPLVVLCHLNRSCESRPNHKPMLSDLRESGSIEQDADQVWFLYRDSYYTRKSSGVDDAEIIVAKQRNGPVGSVKVLWKAETMSFHEVPDISGEW